MSCHRIETSTAVLGRVMQRLGAALVIVAMIQVSVRADESEEDKQKAQVVFDEGLKLFDQGRYGEACPKFQAALELYYTGLGIRGKLAECYERIGKIASAYDHYREVIDRARQRGEPERASFAAERAKILQPRLPKVIIEPGPSADLDGFTLRIGARILHESTYNTEVAVDPGRQVISASADGYQIFEKEITISERETRTIEILALEPLGATDSGGIGTSALGGVLLGIAAVSLGGSAYFYRDARNKNEAFADQYCPMPMDNSEWTCDPEFKDEYDATERAVTFSRVSLAVGVVSAAAGAFLIYRSRSRKPDRNYQSFQIVPSVTPTGVGIVLSHPL